MSTKDILTVVKKIAKFATKGTRKDYSKYLANPGQHSHNHSKSEQEERPERLPKPNPVDDEERHRIRENFLLF